MTTTATATATAISWRQVVVQPVCICVCVCVVSQSVSSSPSNSRQLLKQLLFFQFWETKKEKKKRVREATTKKGAPRPPTYRDRKNHSFGFQPSCASGPNPLMHLVSTLQVPVLGDLYGQVTPIFFPTHPTKKRPWKWFFLSCWLQVITSARLAKSYITQVQHVAPPTPHTCWQKRARVRGEALLYLRPKFPANLLCCSQAAPPRPTQACNVLVMIKPDSEESLAEADTFG